MTEYVITEVGRHHWIGFADRQSIAFCASEKEVTEHRARSNRSRGSSSAAIWFGCDTIELPHAHICNGEAEPAGCAWDRCDHSIEVKKPFHRLLLKWVHPDCWLSERFSFCNIANRGALLCARSGEKPALAQSSPLYTAKGMYLVRARKQELPGAKLLGTLSM
jgi:hypothetical protein